jgi:hypothetical protein
MPKLLFARPPLDATEKRQVRRLAGSRHAPGDWILRARMVARRWAGERTSAIAAALGCHPQTVRERLARFNAEGIDGLGDRPGGGRKPRLREAERGALIALARSTNGHSRPVGPYPMGRSRIILVAGRRVPGPVVCCLRSRGVERAAIPMRQIAALRRIAHDPYPSAHRESPTPHRPAAGGGPAGRPGHRGPAQRPRRWGRSERAPFKCAAGGPSSGDR